MEHPVDHIQVIDGDNEETEDEEEDSDFEVPDNSVSYVLTHADAAATAILFFFDATKKKKKKKKRQEQPGISYSTGSITNFLFM
jgi:hypothetical protein